MENFHKFGKNTFKYMFSSFTISQITSKPNKHFLHDALPAINILEKLLVEKEFSFIKNYRVAQYHFDYYFTDFKIALKVDEYLYEPIDSSSSNSLKKLTVPSLGIQVLKFTDYHILTDPEEIIRAIKFLIQNQRNVIS